MQWAKKIKTITPVASSTERKLLEKAYLEWPSNEQVFRKLIEVLQHENKFDRAVDLCTKHLQLIAKDDYVFSALTHSYRKLNDLDSVIRIGEQAMTCAPTLPTRLDLAYAYIRKKRFDLAKKIMPNDDECSSMDNTSLRFTFKIHLLAQQAQEVFRLYRALPNKKKSDSGLKSTYIKSLNLLGQRAELAKLLDHEAMVKRYQLNVPDNCLPIEMMNQELVTFLSSHSKQQYEPSSHTSKLGSQMHFESHWHPLLQDLEIEMKSKIECYLEESGIAKAGKQDLFSLHLWANVLSKGGHQISHIHPDAFISGVYYLKVPKSIENDNKENSFQGCLLFSQEESNRYYVRPNEGLLVLFPSYFHHETVPLEHQETRVCIAFDVISESAIQ
jgi:uncharacterized protein (TIGR02466 family)